MDQSGPNWFKFNLFGQLESCLDLFRLIRTQFGVFGLIHTYMEQLKNILTKITNFDLLGNVCTIMDQIIYKQFSSPLEHSGPVETNPNTYLAICIQMSSEVLIFNNRYIYGPI